jgi:tellurite resistance protein TerC
MMLWLWTALGVLMLLLMAGEWLLLRYGRPAVRPSEALTGLIVWVVIAVIGFATLIGYAYETDFKAINQVIESVTPLLGTPADIKRLSGTEAWTQFLTAYLTELTLTLDNVAVLALLFAYYRLTPAQASRVLFVGILAALVVRLVLILLGAELLAAYSWFVYVFAALLLVAMLRTLLLPDQQTDFSRRWLTRLVRRVIPLGPQGDGTHWFTRVSGRTVGTPMLLCAIVAGVADVTYTADSIPAAFSITQDPFLAFAAQAMVLLSIRSLYFAVAPVLGRPRYLKLVLVFLMGFIAVKTMGWAGSKVATEISLGVAAAALVTVLWGSYSATRRAAREAGLTGDAVIDGGAGILAPRPAPLEDMAEAALAAKRNFRKMMILIAGTAVIIFAIIIAPLPGPGPTVLIPIGVAILATEFVWAKTLFDRGKALAIRVTDRSDRISKALPRWVVVPALLAFYGFWTAAYFGWWHDFYPGLGEKFWKPFAMATAFGLSFPVLGWAYRLVMRSGSQGQRA